MSQIISVTIPLSAGDDAGLRPRQSLPFPSAWFAACFSKELNPGARRIGSFMGQKRATAARSMTGTWCVRSAMTASDH